jgi:dihydroorotate dehydrogenase
MPNMGYSKAKAQLAAMSFQGPLIVSIAAFSVGGYVEGVSLFGQNTGFVSAIELNLGCPNAHDKKTSPISYDKESFKEIVKSCNALPIDCPVWVKVSPYLTEEDLSDIAACGIDVSHVPVAHHSQLERVAALVAAYPYIRAVVASNTGPNAIYSIDGQPVTTPNAGKAGLSGPVMRMIAERQVARFRAALPEQVDVIHSGGIWNGDDVVSALTNGASGVQCTSLPVWGGGPRSFTDLISGSEMLQNFLQQRM